MASDPRNEFQRGGSCTRQLPYAKKVEISAVSRGSIAEFNLPGRYRRRPSNYPCGQGDHAVRCNRSYRAIARRNRQICGGCNGCGPNPMRTNAEDGRQRGRNREPADSATIHGQSPHSGLFVRFWGR